MAAPSRTAASAATSAAKFTANGGIARRKYLSDSALAITAPSRRPAKPAALENVRAMNRFGYFPMCGTRVTPEKSA